MKSIFTVLFSWLIVPCTFAQHSAHTALTKFMNDEDIQQANVGMYCKNLSNNAVLVETNANKLFTPASIQKILISFAVLEKLGSDFTFKTSFFSNGSIVGNTLNGDLIIHGEGDPSLGSIALDSTQGFDFIFDKVAQELKAKGIQQIEGKFIGDDSYFDAPLQNGRWLWEDIGNYYGVATSGLNINENIFTAKINTFYPGMPVNIESTYPYILDDIVLDNRVYSGEEGSKDKSYYYGFANNKNVTYIGSLPPNRTPYYVKGAIPNSALTAAKLMKFASDKNGIQNAGIYTAMNIESANTTNKTWLYTHESKPLSELLVRLNSQSINLYAESLLLTLGKKFNQANIDSSVSVLSNYLLEKKINNKHFKLYDASGLSPMNKITPKAMVQILESANNSISGEILYNSLPLSGTNGTVKKFLDNSRLKGKLRVKSGSMTGVRCYAGYYTNKRNERIAFCFMLNNYTAKDSIIIPKIENLFLQIFN